MNKRMKRIPMMVLATLCISGLGMLTACNDDVVSSSAPHTHSYTEWKHNDTEHWKECPEDHEIDETTRGNHEYVVGECICGATEPVAPVKFGKVTGKIKLHKQGTFETDFTGVTVDLSDDGAELDFDTATGTFTFENVKVGENHILTITKSGYITYTVQSVQVEENQTATIGGEDGIVLEYDVFGYLENWDSEYHDLSKMNDENPSIGFKEHEGAKTLNVITRESFSNVSASMRINWNNSTHNWHTQGIVLKFEDGNHAVIRYHNGDQENGNIQYANELWSSKKETSVFAASDLNEWGEKPIHTLLSSETDAIKNGDGLDLTVVVNEGKIYTYFAGNWIGTYALPAETVGKKVQVAYFSFDAANNAVFNYKITDAVPSTTSTVNINVNKPEDPEAEAANVTADKESCGIGEEITLTVTKPFGYKLDTLLVNNIDRAGDVANNTLTLIANRSEMNIEATFVKEAPIAINIMMKGKKYGTTAKLPENTVVTFRNTEYSFTVNADGNIVNDAVAKGKYTVMVAGYVAKDIILDENLQEIVLEYDAFEYLEGWDTEYHDFSKANDENPHITFREHEGAKTFNVLTKESFTDVSASLRINWNNSTHNWHTQGIVLKFEDGKRAVIRYHNGDQENGNIQYANALWSATAENSVFAAGDLNQWGEQPIHTLLSSETDAIKNGDGLDLTVVVNEGKIYTYFAGNWIGTYALPAETVGKKVQVAYFSFDAANNAVFNYKISETVPSTTSNVNITVNKPTAPEAATANVTADKESYGIGEEIKLTITKPLGYKLVSLLVNDVDMTQNITGDTLTLSANRAEMNVVATFAEEEKVENVVVSVTGNKFGVTGNALNGETVTLTDGAYSYSAVVEDGSATFTNVVVGNKYSLSAAGYATATGIEVTKEGIANAITLEYNTFYGGLKHWGNYYFENQNQGIIGASNECETILTNDYYGDVAFSITLSGNYEDGTKCGGNQGIAIRFDGGGLVLLRMEGRQKIQFAEPDWYQAEEDRKADGATWNDLIFFNEGDQYLSAYDAGTLKLTLVRQGAKFLAYLNGQYIGEQEVDAKYATLGAQVGIYWANTANDARKNWNVELETDTSSYEIPA